MTQPQPHEADASRSASAAPGDAPHRDELKHSPQAPSGVHGGIANVVVPLLLVVAAVGIGAVLISTPPHVPKSNPEALAPVVGIAELVPQDAQVYVDAFGSVVPSRQTRIMPEVGGRVVELSPNLDDGGLVAEGEVLFKIDPADYEIAVAQAQADLEVARLEASRMRARIDAQKSRGKQLEIEIAYLQWNAERYGRLAEDNSAANAESRDAVTQLESQRAARQTLNAEIAEQEKAVESAEAGIRVVERRVEAAQLALDRTTVTAPFDAIVVSENVEKGQLVSPQTAIATLAATDEFWAEAAIPVERLRDLRFAVENSDSPSRVKVFLATGGDAIVRDGVALRPLGNLDALGRMAQVLVSIRDPLGLTGSGGAAERVLLNSYVRLQIESGTLHDVYAIPRKALRENDRVWVRDTDGQLAIRPIDIVWRRHDDVLVRHAFEDGDMLVTSHLASVVPGMPLRIRDEKTPTGAPQSTESQTTEDETASATP
ncbi:MAG: HlyD family efflux transporter periplasmic adaptor subunit [Phycisphaerales bacterium]|nr:HlyD family efflux transporter periplasmic adaptor subunit [Phycisphaerales bacterium]